MKATFLPIALCSLLYFQTSSSTAYGQLTIGVTGGVASRWSLPKSTDAVGLGYTISAKYRIWKGLTVGAHFSNFKFGPEEKSTSNVDYKINYYSYMGSVEYHLLKNKFKPYAGLEFGLSNYNTVTTIDFGTLGLQKLEKNENYFALSPVIGANYEITKRFGLNANLKLNLVFIPEAAPIGYASLNVGVFYKIFK